MALIVWIQSGLVTVGRMKRETIAASKHSYISSVLQVRVRKIVLQFSLFQLSSKHAPFVLNCIPRTSTLFALDQDLNTSPPPFSCKPAHIPFSASASPGHRVPLNTWKMIKGKLLLSCFFEGVLKVLPWARLLGWPGHLHWLGYVDDNELKQGLHHHYHPHHRPLRPGYPCICIGMRGFITTVYKMPRGPA